MDEVRQYWRDEFRRITGSQETADRLVRLITAYTACSLWTWEETAGATRIDLLKGKSVKEVVQWYADIV